MYGGYGLKVTRVVFPNGSIDPWHALGVTKDLSKEAPALYINGKGKKLFLTHCISCGEEKEVFFAFVLRYV